jgi:hypothetical protein
MNLKLISVDARAQAEGRKATSEEIQEAVNKVWDTWMEASVNADMARAGFIKTETGWASPKRHGFLSYLLNLFT